MIEKDLNNEFSVLINFIKKEEIIINFIVSINRFIFFEFMKYIIKKIVIEWIENIEMYISFLEIKYQENKRIFFYLTLNYRKD